MQSLRLQLLVSHLLNVFIMLIVILISIVNFFHLGYSIDRILKNNYASVVAAQNMKETLERQDSAASFYISGHITEARSQYLLNCPIFQKWYDVEAHNITEPGEQNAADIIGSEFPQYRKSIEKLIYSNTVMTNSQRKDYYFAKLEPAFLRLKYQIQHILDINQEAIIQAKNRAELEAKYASWFCIIAAIFAITLTIILTRRTIRTLVAPLNTLAKQAEEIGNGKLDQLIDIDGPTEISILAVSFNQMADRLLATRRIEERRLHRAERMSYVALESLYDPVIITDASNAIVHINKAAELLFGRSREVERKPIEDVVSEPSITHAIYHVIQHGTSYDSEGNQALIPIHNGTKDRFYRMRAAPMRDDDDSLLGAVAVLEDITHLHELDRLKTEFISVASHELRTPVTSLLLSVDLLQGGVAGRLTKKQCKLVQAQRDDLERLQRLMRDLLDLSRLEAGVDPPILANLSVIDIVNDIVAGFKSQAEEKNISISIESADTNLNILSDRGQISRIIMNLLDNAIRHTDNGGYITIKIYLQDQDDKVAIAIIDSGIGIPEEYLPRIFERFVQVPGATRGGSGLGLSIAVAIAKAHSGLITVKSNLGQGSTFTLLLPITNRSENINAHTRN